MPFSQLVAFQISYLGNYLGQNNYFPKKRLAHLAHVVLASVLIAFPSLGCKDTTSKQCAIDMGLSRWGRGKQNGPGDQVLDRFAAADSLRYGFIPGVAHQHLEEKDWGHCGLQCICSCVSGLQSQCSAQDQCLNKPKFTLEKNSSLILILCACAGF